MNIGVKIIDYSGSTTVTEKVLPLAEAIFLKEETEKEEKKVARFFVPPAEVSGYLYNLGEGVKVILTDQVGEKKSFDPVVITTSKQLEAAVVYSVIGRFKDGEWEKGEEEWELEETSYPSLTLRENECYESYFRIFSRAPISESEVEAAKAEVERRWMFAHTTTEACRQIFEKLSHEEQNFLRKNLRSGVAP